ncbi:unnamed protein product [Calicophoron daubneyi]|uniref:Uncharacterized protein n=1 Tax=Calicophoron daubneyi TaxID=300641 RepID=A0AAV2T9C4_CALDB
MDTHFSKTLTADSTICLAFLADIQNIGKTNEMIKDTFEIARGVKPESALTSTNANTEAKSFGRQSAKVCKICLFLRSRLHACNVMLWPIAPMIMNRKNETPYVDIDEEHTHDSSTLDLQYLPTTASLCIAISKHMIVSQKEMGKFELKNWFIHPWTNVDTVTKLEMFGVVGLLGYLPQYLIDRSLSEFIHPLDSHRFTEWLCSSESHKANINQRVPIICRWRCANSTYARLLISHLCCSTRSSIETAKRTEADSPFRKHIYRLTWVDGPGNVSGFYEFDRSWIREAQRAQSAPASSNGRILNSKTAGPSEISHSSQRHQRTKIRIHSSNSANSYPMGARQLKSSSRPAPHVRTGLVSRKSRPKKNSHLHGKDNPLSIFKRTIYDVSRSAKEQDGTRRIRSDKHRKPHSTRVDGCLTKTACFRRRIRMLEAEYLKAQLSSISNLRKSSKISPLHTYSAERVFRTCDLKLIPSVEYGISKSNGCHSSPKYKRGRVENPIIDLQHEKRGVLITRSSGKPRMRTQTDSQDAAIRSVGSERVHPDLGQPAFLSSRQDTDTPKSLPSSTAEKSEYNANYPNVLPLTKENLMRHTRMHEYMFRYQILCKQLNDNNKEQKIEGRIEKMESCCGIPELPTAKRPHLSAELHVGNNEPIRIGYPIQTNVIQHQTENVPFHSRHYETEAIVGKTNPCQPELGRK